MNQWGIKRKVFMLGLLPALLTALLLSMVFMYTQYHDLGKSLENRGAVITNQLAQISEFGVYSGNTDLLQLLIQNVKSESDVVYISVNDKNQSLVSVGKIPDLYPQGDVTKPYFVRSRSGGELVFHAPIFQTQAVVSDGVEDDMMSDKAPRYQRTTKILGYVIVILSRESTIFRQQGLIKNNLIVTLSILLVTGLFATYIGRQVSDPIIRLTNAVSEMEHGNLNARVIPERGGELKTLGHGFNLMGEALKNSQQELHNKIDDATLQLRLALSELEIKNKELERQRSQALDASKAKSRFLANMSHELRTPLNAIIGYSEMLQEDAKEQIHEDLVQDLGKIHGAGNHLLSLINDVLDLSKIEAGKMELYMEYFNIRPLLQDVTATTGPLLDKNNNKLFLDCPESVGSMYADITKLRQSLLNLISNASKFTTNGTITVKVSRQKTSGRDSVSFSISDSGIGMTGEQLDGLFRPFTQADASTTRRFGGTGLGLTITKHFIEMMGGEIDVISTPGQGSTFVIHIPEDSNNSSVVQEEDSREVEVRRVVNEVSKHERRGSACTVLCIDDDIFVRDLLKRFLASEGFNFIGASTGAEGLAIALAEKPDVITLDIMMPEMDGWRVIQQLKSNDKLADIPVVIVSMVDGLRKGVALGAADYLSKPIDWQRLFASIKRSIRKNSDQTVLLIEDNSDSRVLIRNMLEKFDWHVVEAENGREGLLCLNKARPAIILLDLMMPEMNGFEFIFEFNQHPEWKDIPIIVLTAADLSNEQKMLLQNSVDSIIKKYEYATKDLCEQVGRYVKSYIQ